MIYYFLIGILNVSLINSFVLQDSYNIQLKDRAHYKVDESLNEDDLEMIDKQYLREFGLDDKKNKIYGLNRVVGKEFSNSLKQPSVLMQHDFDTKVLTKSEDQQYQHERTTKSLKTQNVVFKRKGTTEGDKQYDYEENLREYYEEMIYDEQHNDTYHPSAARQDLLYYLKYLATLDRESNKSRLATFQRLVVGYKKEYTKQELADKWWNILKIWIIIYLIIAVPLWCTKGWCCCCLCCKFFKPRETIIQAKKYLTENPPGMQKSRKDHILYEPTDQERRAYLEFEHLIRII